LLVAFINLQFKDIKFTQPDLHKSQ